MSDVTAKLEQLYKLAGLWGGEHRSLASDIFCEVRMLEADRDRLEQTRAYYVAWIRRLEGLDDTGRPLSFGRWLARLFGVRQ